MVLFTCIFRYALSFLFYSFNELKLKSYSKTKAIEHFSECKYKTLFLAHKEFLNDFLKNIYLLCYGLVFSRLNLLKEVPYQPKTY
jgi:hypothetical protein